MNFSRLSFAFFLALATAALAAASEREVRRTFPVEPGCTLKIDTYRGNITIVEADAPEVKVDIQLAIGADDEAEADRMMAALQLDLNEAGNVVTIRARNPAETRARWIWAENKQIGLEYRLTVPRRCSVDLKTLQGSIIVGRIEGRAVARAEIGSVFLRGVTGDAEARADFGDVVISRCSGSVQARVLRGLIRTGPIGPGELTNDHGDIEVMLAQGPLTAKAGVGDVSVEFPATLGGDARLTSAGGNVWARIEAAANGLIEASATWGRVRCTLPVVAESGGPGARKLAGKINAGGPVLRLHASGDVTIAPAAARVE